jgi:hypothetical protein
VIDAQVTVALCHLELLVLEYLGYLQEGCPVLRQIGGADRTGAAAAVRPAVRRW